MFILLIRMCLQSLMKFYCFSKILLRRNKNVADRKTDGRTDGKRENSIPYKHSLRGGGEGGGIIRNHNLYQWKGHLFVYISAEGFDWKKKIRQGVHILKIVFRRCADRWKHCYTNEALPRVNGKVTCFHVSLKLIVVFFFTCFSKSKSWFLKFLFP